MIGIENDRLVLKPEGSDDTGAQITPWEVSSPAVVRHSRYCTVFQVIVCGRKLPRPRRQVSTGAKDSADRGSKTGLVGVL